tara:strand:- start:1568 stop:2719 length:1152 start_codon:yes stop_codon:yes gene_type:complete
MSSIRLKHASGNAVTIAAPSSNPSSNKTINLPDEAGIFATKDSANSLQNVTGVNGSALSNRRMNINGACLVSQRGNKTGLTVSGAPHYVVDRFRHYFTEGTFSISQENDAPAGSGFTKSLKIQCTTADTSQDAGAVHNLTYPFEGQDLQRLAKGSSGAKQLAVQFWCKAYQTGAFNITLFDEDNNRFTNQTFTISASNTWEKKELIFPADTTGTIIADNSVSLNLDIKLAVGTNYTSGSLQTAWGASTTANSGVGQTVNIADNTNNNFYITGLQIEVGNVHTEYEHKLITEELALCQRYFETGNGLLLAAYSGGAFGGGITLNEFAVTKRATPTITVTQGSGLGSQTASNVNTNTTYNVGVHWSGSATAGDYRAFTFTASAEL